ncbi:Inner membrane protein yihN [Serratia fonticola]|nr:Inner membrane protein yihN [Serratia fonticola]
MMGFSKVSKCNRTSFIGYSPTMFCYNMYGYVLDANRYQIVFSLAGVGICVSEMLIKSIRQNGSLNTLDGWKTTQPSAAPNAAQLNVTSISVEAVTAPIGTLLPPEHSRQVS